MFGLTHMSSLTESLHADGWTDPLDESPFDLPNNWTGGDVRNTGGNIFCRVWRTDADTDETMYEVMYGDQFEGVEMSRYVPSPDGDYHDYDGSVVMRDAPEHTNEACTGVAQELMVNLAEYTDD